MLERTIDVVICLAILALAIRVVTGRDLFRSIVFFIAMGLVLALAWVRLAAPDIALAEAAIGAGLTGVLLIRAAQGSVEMRVADSVRGTASWLRSARQSWLRPRTIAGVAATLAIGATLAVATMRLPSEAGGLTDLAMTNLGESGIDQPVTAVLLSFRAYDTWLEIGVLLLAVVGVLAVHRSSDFRGVHADLPSLRVLSWLARALLPLTLLVAGYLYWAGTHSPGGAFQAGAILAAALVLLALAGFRGVAVLRARPLAFFLAFSFGAFLVAAILASAFEGMLHYRGDTGGLVIIALELTIVLSTAVTLAALFAGAGAEAPAREEEEPEAERERPATL